ncbi:hypothetical protein LOTGIDRAFT_230095 [Lottia gigantea]|uniref:Alanine racemase C-terminal domain-containing protein n=1 Tax=Lottia gigantea TaxID=225164 RepID=V4B0P7_LOTGI|nr:hypothetical protein LOTGIDRAFT_230095 [Lottia gigantea]ESP03763.1 hypothetical protein LOTGIDRAFT_230095 [Lottia gigantea]
MCADVIAVIKANAYGHGSVEIAKHLENNGVSHFAIATAGEGGELRRNGVKGFIQVFGSCVKEDIAVCQEFHLTPTVCCQEFLQHWSDWFHNNNNHSSSQEKPWVVIKVDCGMCRNGCQPEQLPELIQKCKDLHIPIHSAMTHFSQAWDDPEFTKKQLDLFLQTCRHLRSEGVKLHASNSAGIIQGFGIELDFIRPGIAIYGLPTDPSEETVNKFQSIGLKPALSWLAKPSLVKKLPPGSVVGYDQTYQCKKEEIIGTFSIGYADGYNRHLSTNGMISNISGDQYPVIGRVSMDAITVRLDSLDSNQVYYIMKDDYVSGHSLTKIAAELKTIPYEIGTSLSKRLPRVYISGGKVVAVSNGF